MREGLDPQAIVAKHQETLPVQLGLIARDLGIAVYREPLGETVAGMIRRDPIRGGKSGFAITINISTHPNRQKFTFAHEIAHYILHRDLIESGLVDDTMYRSNLSNYYETQANRMAADILMPMAQVKALWDRWKSLSLLAGRFGVSEAAMKIRLEAANVDLDQGILAF